MIKYLQERVNKRTKEYENSVPEALRATEDATAEAQDLAKKQVRIRDLTRKLGDKLNQENHGAEGGK
jgi:hypothetical protein